MRATETFVTRKAFTPSLLLSRAVCEVCTLLKEACWVLSKRQLVCVNPVSKTVILSLSLSFFSLINGVKIYCVENFSCIKTGLPTTAFNSNFKTAMQICRLLSFNVGYLWFRDLRIFPCLSYSWTSNSHHSSLFCLKLPTSKSFNMFILF